MAVAGMMKEVGSDMDTGPVHPIPQGGAPALQDLVAGGVCREAACVCGMRQ